MRILLLGSTGSIGTSACRCVQRYPERFQLVGLAANRSAELLVEQTKQFGPEAVYVADSHAAQRITDQLPDTIGVFSGAEGLQAMVNELEYDVLLNALVGSVGLVPTVAALKRNKRVALANKESLVVGGEYITSLLNAGHGELIPVDSEHSAILQCLHGEDSRHIESLVLTASGGPFRELPSDRFASIQPCDALNHPTWSMGSKITIDSATLMNKGFEVIEAHHLFNVDYDRVRVCIHPQSIIHSVVEFHDGAMIAQLGVPDMELPIQYALSYPERLPLQGRRLRLSEIGTLTFSKPDLQRFPCLRLCLEAGRTGGTAPVVLNAANEVAVEQFLAHVIPFEAIAAIIEDALSHHTVEQADSVETIVATDAETRKRIRRKGSDSR